MRVADVMQTNVRTIYQDQMVAEAISLMAELHVSGLPVVDTTERVVGVLSTSDILQAEAESAGDDRRNLIDNTPVGEIMTPRPLMVAPSATIHEVAQQMLYAEVHRLFVEDGDKMVGVVSQTDLVRAFATRRAVV
jgi:CIC family chloride channel protein